MFDRVKLKIVVITVFMIIATLADGFITFIRVSPEGAEEANPLTRWGISMFGKPIIPLFSLIEAFIGIILVKKFKNWIVMTILAWWGYFHWAGFLSWQPEIFSYLATLGFFGILLSLSLYPLPILILLSLMIIELFPVKQK